MQYNPKDPMNKVLDDRARALFREFGKLCNGAPNDVILMAAFNVILSAVRQKHPRRQGALNDFDQMMIKFRTLLADKHYSVSGKRLNIFPFTQNIEVSHFNAKDVKLS